MYRPQAPQPADDRARRLHDELRADYHAIVMAEDGAAAQRASTAFCRKWAKTCAGAVKSLQEAGAELLTMYRYPRSQWKEPPQHQRARTAEPGVSGPREDPRQPAE